MLRPSFWKSSGGQPREDGVASSPRGGPRGHPRLMLAAAGQGRAPDRMADSHQATPVQDLGTRAGARDAPMRIIVAVNRCQQKSDQELAELVGRVTRRLRGSARAGRRRRCRLRANLFQAQGGLAAARALLECALAAYERVQGPGHPQGAPMEHDEFLEA